MSEVEERKANPYNARKSWHESDDSARTSADSLFFEDPEATPSADSEPETPQTKQSQKPRANYKKRYDDLKKHYDDKIAEFKQREQELLAQAKGAQPQYQPPRSEEDLAEFRSKYPELYETVETVAHMRSQEQVNALQEKLQAIEARELELSRRDAETKLRERHPDFEDIRGDEQFHSWAKEQPEEIQRWIYNNPDNVTLASRAIDLYKMENGININAPKPRANRSQSAKKSAADFVSTKTTTVDTKQPKIWTQREIAALSMDDYDKYEQEIDLAIREGRVAP